MKKLILAVLSVISYCSYAEVNKELYNNYMIFDVEAASPHSKPIKLQEITSHVTAIKEISLDDKPIYLAKQLFRSNEVIIKSSLDNGLITYMEQEKQVQEEKIKTKLQIDYDKKESLFEIEGQTKEPKLTFNENNSISSISLPSAKTIYIYNENNQIVNMISNYLDFAFDSNTEFVYTNNGSFKSYHTIAKRDSVSKAKTTEFIYDNKHRLVEIIATTYRESPLDDQVSDIQHCYFSEHNDDGDWTMAECNEKDTPYVEKITRKIEY